ncbi:hypothetical protein Q5P01_022046 [Channa striata]|uniref:Solute carrier family 22 member 13 n=1 Tax=Channa striata TaxID=64152 RepID=A0AA88LQX2_CHASR|nr:hypothetical protein Q5P01_022046 [Channa striata]
MADFGEILRSVGEFGLFQKTLLIALCFPNAILPFHFASVLFIQSDPERHCNTDWILRTGPNLTIDEQLNLTLPREEDGSFSRCRMFVPVDWDIGAIREYGLNETTVCQSGWIYSNTLYEATIVTDIFGAAGQCLLAAMIYGIRDWRLAQLITAAPLTLAGISIWFIPESARWLLDRGKTEEAKQLITKVAAINKRTVPDSLLDKTASGLGSIASRAGGLLSPLLNMLAIYHWSIPIIVFSSLMLVSGALSFLLPETRRTELPDSTDQAEGNRNKATKIRSASSMPPQSRSTKL